MSAFLGGSAYSMASQVADGFIMMTNVTMKKFQMHEAKLLETEIEKLQREVRAENPPLEDQVAVQKKNRKLGRLNQAMLIIKNYYEQRR